MKKYLWNIDEIAEAVTTSHSYSGVLAKLGIPNRGNNIKTLKDKIRDAKMDVSHFTGQSYKRGKSNYKYLSASQYLKNGSRIKSFVLKEKLIQEGIKEAACEICGISNWMYRPIILQLHHINGRHDDNRLENLQILCPNCHSQTETFAGKANKHIEYKNTCIVCGKRISCGSTYCRKCYDYNIRRKIRVSDEDLIKEYGETKNLSLLARKYGVTATAIRNRLKLLG